MIQTMDRQGTRLQTGGIFALAGFVTTSKACTRQVDRGARARKGVQHKALQKVWNIRGATVVEPWEAAICVGAPTASSTNTCSHSSAVNQPHLNTYLDSQGGPHPPHLT